MMREITSFSLGVFLLLLWGQVTPYSLPLQRERLFQDIIQERMGMDFGSSFHKLSKRDASPDINSHQVWHILDQAAPKAWGLYVRSKIMMGADVLQDEKSNMICDIYGNELWKVEMKYDDGKLTKEQREESIQRIYLGWEVKHVQVFIRELNLNATDLSISNDQFEILQNLAPFEGIKSNCDAGFFQCQYGICINPDLVCDGSNDCLDDEDEENCTSVVNETTTTTEFNIQQTTDNPKLVQNITECQDATNFQCKDGTCIPFEWTCDGKANCLNSEDEQNCDIDQDLKSKDDNNGQHKPQVRGVNEATTATESDIVGKTVQHTTDNPHHETDEDDTENHKEKSEKKTIKHLPISF
eukprot:TRINITY_DN2288_c0_g1_i10.p1 TRINITY_DN2288_c0_g1~~TRINITY_DN2288_c0_g1_i10.p1  ORF type:complete len:355 (+),score=62.60 TRINITY_DN2288_c0_g1_i10:119-1183(+)